MEFLPQKRRQLGHQSSGKPCLSMAWEMVQTKSCAYLPKSRFRFWRISSDEFVQGVACNFPVRTLSQIIEEFRQGVDHCFAAFCQPTSGAAWHGFMNWIHSLISLHLMSPVAGEGLFDLNSGAACSRAESVWIFGR